MAWLSILSTAFNLFNRIVRWMERSRLIAQGRSQATQAYTIKYLKSKGASDKLIARAALQPIEEVRKRLDHTDFVD